MNATASRDQHRRIPVRMTLSKGTRVATVLAAPLFAGDSEALLDALQRLAATATRPALVVTPNVDQLLLLETDAEWRVAFTGAAIRIVDGMPVVALARILGARGVERLTGADLLPAVAARADLDGGRVAIIGGSAGARERAVERLRREHPGAIIEGFDVPYSSDPADAGSEPTIEALADFAPDYAFICLGAPKQEKWFLAWESRLPPAVYIGAGAAVDFAAGAVSRAPRWMQRSGLEWLYRLSREPRRLAYRYLVRGPRYLLVIARSLSARRARG